jgi:hypothetical protein
VRPSTIICLACRDVLLEAHFQRKSAVCVKCSKLSLTDLVITALGAANLPLPDGSRIVQSTRKQVKREQLHAQYAVTGKRCSACHARKTAAEYAVSNNRADGLQPTCNACGKLHLLLIKKAPFGTGVTLWHSTRDAMRVVNDQANYVASVSELRAAETNLS